MQERARGEEKKREEENKKKVEEKAQKAAEQAKKAAERATQRSQRVTWRKGSAKSLPLTSKKKKTVTTCNPEINENECCVCSGTYKDVEEGNCRGWNCTCWMLAT